jgi:hypothetical protein
LSHLRLVPRISGIDKVEIDPKGRDTEGRVQFREQGWSAVEKVELIVVVLLASLLLYLMVT